MQIYITWLYAKPVWRVELEYFHMVEMLLVLPWIENIRERRNKKKIQWKSEVDNSVNHPAKLFNILGSTDLIFPKCLSIQFSSKWSMIASCTPFCFIWPYKWHENSSSTSNVSVFKGKPPRFVNTSINFSASVKWVKFFLF